MNPHIEQKYQILFSQLRELLESEEFLRRHRQTETAFTRKRSLPFTTVILILVNMVKRALQDELDEFFRALNGDKVAQRHVSKSAFSQARKKLKHTAFIELNETQVRCFYTEFESMKWHGYRLLGIDGSMVDVPDTPANRAHFGQWTGAQGQGHAKGRISQLFDVLNRITIEASLAPNAQGERELAHKHLARIGTGDLVLLDRGYPAYWFFAAIRQQGADFCARLNVSQWQTAQEFVASGQQEAIITPSLTASSRKLCQQHGVPETTQTLRFIRVELSTGEIEVLVTSLLDVVRFPYSLFKELYHQRWPVEEDYKQVKSRLEVENWSGLTQEATYQDFHATFFTKNLTAVFAHGAEPTVTTYTQHRKHRYQINRTNLVSKMKDTILFLFRDRQIQPILTALWNQMIKTIEPIRPNRSFPRIKKVHRKKYPTNYKSTR